MSTDSHFTGGLVMGGWSEATVKFIEADFRVQHIPLPDLRDDEIRTVEDKLVQALSPELNVVGNRSIRSI